MSDGENSLLLSVSLAGLTQWLRHRRQTAASLWLPLFAIWKPVTSLPQTSAAALSGCLLGCLSACQSFSWAVSNWVLAGMLIVHCAAFAISSSFLYLDVRLQSAIFSWVHVLTLLDLWPLVCPSFYHHPFLLTQTVLLLPTCVCKQSIPPWAPISGQ